MGSKPCSGAARLAKEMTALFHNSTVHRMTVGETQTAYSVRAQHPVSGLAIAESYASIPATIARATELLRDGYTIEIRSVSLVMRR